LTSEGQDRVFGMHRGDPLGEQFYGHSVPSPYRTVTARPGRIVVKLEVDIPAGRVVAQRNIRGRPFGVGFDFCSLRSDCRQGSWPAARRSARASLRLQSFYGGAGAPRFLVVPDCDFTNCLWSWRSCRLRKIALRAPYCKIFRQGYRGAPL
jgi:hypothetical protein